MPTTDFGTYEELVGGASTMVLIRHLEWLRARTRASEQGTGLRYRDYGGVGADQLSLQNVVMIAFQAYGGQMGVRWDLQQWPEPNLARRSPLGIPQCNGDSYPLYHPYNHCHPSSSCLLIKLMCLPYVQRCSRRSKRFGDYRVLGLFIIDRFSLVHAGFLDGFRRITRSHRDPPQATNNRSTRIGVLRARRATVVKRRSPITIARTPRPSPGGVMARGIAHNQTDPAQYPWVRNRYRVIDRTRPTKVYASWWGAEREAFITYTPYQSPALYATQRRQATAGSECGPTVLRSVIAVTGPPI